MLAAKLPYRAGLLVMIISTGFTTASAQTEAPQGGQIALAGSWTSVPDDPRVQPPASPSQGLYLLARQADGRLTQMAVLAMKSPSWIASPADGRFAWVTNEENNGAVTALSRNAAGQFTVINSVSSQGQQPTHAAVSPDGRFLIVANYSVAKGGAGIAVIPVAKNGALSDSVQEFLYPDGSGVVPGRQQSGHAHSVNFTPDGSMLYVADLGADRLHAYRYQANNALPLQAVPARDVIQPPGSGPRHMVFSTDGHYGWLITEMSAELVSFTVSDGALQETQRLSLTPQTDAGYKSGSGLILSPDGRYLLALNRGLDSCVRVYRITLGQLTPHSDVAAGGAEPRALSFDRSGQQLYVTNVFSNDISLFRFDAERGELTPQGTAAGISTVTDIRFFSQ